MDYIMDYTMDHTIDFSSPNNLYILNQLTSIIPEITKQMIQIIKNNKDITLRNHINIEPIMKNIVRINTQLHTYNIPDGFDYRLHMSPIRQLIQDNPTFIPALATFLITFNSTDGINTGFAHIVDTLFSKGVMVSDISIYKEHPVIIGMRKYIEKHTNGFNNINIITNKIPINSSVATKFNTNFNKQIFRLLLDVYIEFRPDDNIVVNLLDNHQ